MKITRQYINGKWEPPFTPEELARHEARFSWMCETRQAPATVGSEKAFLADVDLRNHGLGDSPDFLQEMVIAKAKRAGIAVDGKRYFGGLADSRGPADPEAWCATQQDFLDTVKRRDLVSRSGCGIGGVNHNTDAEPGPPPPDIDLAPDIVNRLDRQYTQADPDFAQKPKQERREAIIERHGRRKKRQPRGWRPDANWRE